MPDAQLTPLSDASASIAAAGVTARPAAAFDAGTPPASVTDTSAARSAASSEAASDLAPPPTNLPCVDDATMATLVAQQAAPALLLVVANAFIVTVFSRPTELDAWTAMCCGELGERAAAALTAAAPKRLFWASTEDAPWTVPIDQLQPEQATKALVSRWLKTSDQETGREGGLSPAVYEEVTSRAAWRCQFSGCGKDLKTHGATGKRLRSSYFAHIVASSPSGPRGSKRDSRLLADNPTNFLLLCDECHRLIDKQEPATYTVEVLRAMRETSIVEVERLLDSLRFPDAEVITVLGNIANQPPQFNMRDAHDALRASKLRSPSNTARGFFYPGGQHHSPHEADYWPSLFRTLRTDIPRLQALLTGTSESGAPRPRLAVFPLHCTSVLVLAGRLLGDMAGTHLFQPHRNAKGNETRWAWPSDAPTAAPDKFILTELKPFVAGAEEACLVVALTSDIPASRMPPTCAANGSYVLPTLQIGPVLGKDCVQHLSDLDALAVTVDAAVRRLQDEWGVKRVHLFVSAPTTATVLIGQKMQARHHAVFVCHEAVGGAGSMYAATIELTTTHVHELVSGKAQSISLQP